MDNGTNILRKIEQDCFLDKHYILYGNAKSFDNDIGKVTYKYNYVTIKMQFEIDRLKAQIEMLKTQKKD
tara:strand:- start:293 stop:499 length:207 start_codon:yes stop_codon:yes gene_type:complete